ncbi:MAG: helix-turn-helix domain-containing protein [Methanotrichaceae archaeon]
MKIIKLLVILAILSLLVAPALSVPTGKACACMSGCCGSSNGMNCGSKTSDGSCSSQICACPGQISSSSSMEIYGLGYSYLGKGSSRPEDREGAWSVSPYPGKGGTYSGVPSTYSDNVGPPDLDVVEYLPPSAKLVFNVLASDGPLTQKDLISKTDLPPRTVRYALSRLKDESVIKECFYFADARQSLYGLNTTAFKATRS